MSNEAFFTEPRTLKIRGKDVQVFPFESRMLKQAARLAKPIFAAIAGTGADPKPEAVAAVFGADDVFDLLEHADEIIDLVALSTKQDSAEVGALLPDELLLLAAAVFQENFDFFTRRLMPAAMQAFGEIENGARGTMNGLSSSLPSVPSGSASTT